MDVGRLLQPVVETQPCFMEAPVNSRAGFPKAPCTHIVYTLAPKYPNRDYFKAKV